MTDTQPTRKNLRAALVQLCQSHGITNAATYTLADRLADTVDFGPENLDAWTYEGGVQPAGDGEQTFGWIDAEYGDGEGDPRKQFGIKLDEDDGTLVVHVLGDRDVAYRVQDDREDTSTASVEPEPEPEWKYAVELGANATGAGNLDRECVLEWGLFRTYPEAAQAATSVLGFSVLFAEESTPEGIECTAQYDGDQEDWTIVGYTIERYDGEMTDPSWQIHSTIYPR